MDKCGAIAELEDIIKYAEEDVGVFINYYLSVYLTYKGVPGSVIVPRLLFPEVDNLGSLYAGTTTQSAKNSCNFIKEYFGRVNVLYKDRGGLLYYIYRHGTLHQHYPKDIIYHKKRVGFAITFSPKGTLHLKLLDGDLFVLNNLQFYRDFILALKMYKKDVEDSPDNSDLIDKFCKATDEMRQIEHAKILRINKSSLSGSDLDFLGTACDAE